MTGKKFFSEKQEFTDLPPSAAQPQSKGCHPE
jgi:hypothetical protein